MSFVFPQFRGLSASPNSQRFGISGRHKARACLSHPLPGSRLVECTQFVGAALQRQDVQSFGCPDNLKLQSSMTLFATLDPETAIFASAIELFFVVARSAAALRTLD